MTSEEFAIRARASREWSEKTLPGLREMMLRAADLIERGDPPTRSALLELDDDVCDAAARDGFLHRSWLLLHADCPLRSSVATGTYGSRAVMAIDQDLGYSGQRSRALSLLAEVFNRFGINGMVWTTCAPAHEVFRYLTPPGVLCLLLPDGRFANRLPFGHFRFPAMDEEAPSPDWHPIRDARNSTIGWVDPERRALLLRFHPFMKNGHGRFTFARAGARTAALSQAIELAMPELANVEREASFDPAAVLDCLAEASRAAQLVSRKHTLVRAANRLRTERENIDAALASLLPDRLRALAGEIEQIEQMEEVANVTLKYSSNLRELLEVELHAQAIARDLPRTILIPLELGPSATAVVGNGHGLVEAVIPYATALADRRYALAFRIALGELRSRAERA